MEKFINFNQDITELKDNNASINLIKHAIDNTDRKTQPELINKNPELKNRALIKTSIEKVNKELEETKNLKKGGKGAKPFRFIVSSLNVEPTKENEALINEWAEEMIKHYKKYFNIEGAYLHLNETHPHIHIIAKNFNQKEWGNFVDGKKIKLSGFKTGSKDLITRIHKEGQEINKKLAKKYGKEFKQQPTTAWGSRRKEKQMRQDLERGDLNQDDINKIIKYLQDKKLIKTNNVDIKKLLLNRKMLEQIVKVWGQKRQDGTLYTVEQQLKDLPKERQRADYNAQGWEDEIKKTKELQNTIDVLKAKLEALETRKPISRGRTIGGR